MIYYFKEYNTLIISCIGISSDKLSLESELILNEISSIFLKKVIILEN